MDVSLRGFQGERWGEGERGKDIWNRKNLIQGRKMQKVCSVCLEERAGGKQLCWARLEGLG